MSNYPGPNYLRCGESDDDPPTLRSRCFCGCFISQKPVEVQRQVGPDVYEVDWVWVCKACGRELESWEVGT